MKGILTILLLTLNLSINSNTNSIKGKGLVNIISNRDNIRQTEYMKEYNNMIEFLKLKEGFSATLYDDHNFLAIGFGQRIKFYRHKISEPISREQAEDILKVSLEDHFRMVRRIYPKVKGNKLLAMAHVSYTIGIGRLKQLYHSNQLDTTRLLSIGDKSCRQFEINLFTK